MSDDTECKQIVIAIRESIAKLRDALAPEIGPEHELKRELEKWFRDKGFSRSQAKRAVSSAFSSLHQSE